MNSVGATSNESIADLIPKWFEGGTTEQMLEEALAQIRTLEWRLSKPTIMEMSRLVRIGCRAAEVHLDCSYPTCTCKQVPTAVLAVLAERRSETEATPTYGPSRDELKAIFPLLWHINDRLRITPDQGVEYIGSTNDVDNFRERLHKLDPQMDLGTDHEGTTYEDWLAENHRPQHDHYDY